jgi:hypothetical protein
MIYPAMLSRLSRRVSAARARGFCPRTHYPFFHIVVRAQFVHVNERPVNEADLSFV